MTAIRANIKTFLGSFTATVVLLSGTLTAYERLSPSRDTAVDLTVEEAVNSIQQSVGYDLEPFAFDALFRDSNHLRQQVHFLSGKIQSHSRSAANTRSLASLIVTESLRAEVDPLFIASVIRSESGFKHRAVSHKGAQGLMQITPSTGAYISRNSKIPWRGSASLLDPATNVRLGIEYLKYLDRKFNGNREKILIAYNWGPGNLQEAVKYRRRVPGESVRYAQTILATHKNWKNSLVGYAANLSAPNSGSVG